MSRQASTTSSPFAARLNEAIESSEFGSVEQLAREIDVTLRVVQKWRAGDGQPSGANLVKLAKALGREPAWFFTGGGQVEAA